MFQRPLYLALWSTVAATALCSVAAHAKEPADLAIRNVTVIDPEHGNTSPGRDVLVEDGRILAVVASSGAAPEAEHVIDGTGKFLIPGLMDMHSHSNYRMLHTATLKLMSANGVTGIREMGSDCDEPGGFTMCLGEMRESQAKIEAGEMVGPRIVELSTKKIQSERPKDPNEYQILYTPMTAEDGRATVAGLAERGPDILKIGDQFMPDAFRALAEAARERGMKFGGHVPMMFSVADVSDMGMTSIEHARDLPLDCSAFGAEFRGQIMAKLSGEDVPWPNRRAMPGNARDTFDEATCKAQIATLAANHTYYVPTHPTREMDFRAGEQAYRDDPRLSYITQMQQEHWNRDLDRTASAPPEAIADLADFFALTLKTTKMAHDGGVKIMAGTDANDTMIFPGFSLHDELGFMVQAGLTPMEALQTATSVPAEYLGRTKDFGGVSQGKLADLVLLDADPTVDIANTMKIAAVIQGGQVHDRAALDGLLEDVRNWVALANEKMKAAE